jgi:hypothetical protein
MRDHFGLAAALAAVALSASATAAPASFPSLYPFCTEQVQVFSSLRHGEFDYCRLHLRYVPGSIDCLRIVATACNAWVPEGQATVLRQGLDGRAERIVCPPGPPPPSCPSGYPAGPIPRRW